MKIFYIYNVKIEPLTHSPLYLYRWIFTLDQFWASQTGSIPLKPRKPYPLPTGTKMVWENCLLHLGSTSSVFMSFPGQYLWDLIKNFYLYRWKSSDPLPPLSLHCKNRNFSPDFDSIPKTGLKMFVVVIPKEAMAGSDPATSIILSCAREVGSQPTHHWMAQTDQPFSPLRWTIPSKLTCISAWIDTDKTWIIFETYGKILWPGTRQYVYAFFWYDINCNIYNVIYEDF